MTLTLLDLTDMKPGIFAGGRALVEDYWDDSEGMLVDWVAVRGAVPDWCIYYKLAIEEWDQEQIRHHGDKMRNPKSILQCIRADEEALKMYIY